VGLTLYSPRRKELRPPADHTNRPGQWHGLRSHYRRLRSRHIRQRRVDHLILSICWNTATLLTPRRC